MSHADALNIQLVEALRSQGVEAELSEGWVACAAPGPALRVGTAALVEAEGARAQVDVQVALPDGRLLVESHAAARPTEDEAIAAAWAQFLGNSFHPLTSALWGRSLGEHGSTDVWTLCDGAWTVHVGNFGVEASAVRAEGGGDSGPPPPPPGDLPAVLKRLICERPSERRSLSWLRLFIAFEDGEAVATEVLYDGVPWPEARAEIEGLDWEKRAGFYSARLFLVLTKEEPAPPRWPHDYRQTVALVRRFVAAIEAYPERSDDDHCEQLIDEGVDYEVAEALVTFTAVAFAYHLFRELELSAEYYIANERQEILGTRRLEQEPAFLAASEVAREFDLESKPALTTVATRADLFHVLGAALANNHPIPDTRVVRVVDEDIASVSSSAAPSAVDRADVAKVSEASPGAPLEAPTTARPWWRFWA